mmetsp:Transcript_18534/g.22680  ORF Transcript_18534/g.22680 Transcript_18534/m.22680 type:complete len:157 (-) Transcript_18534:404-874(-)|eukprot:CAMPEP_0204824798 /NCGR_PEP_ID=MMETSP1346-20131115/2772_1 /ASSEMBLY_ACC=CAM_ASM_000771 /TAXON_ID=215587 /ORGANISM="Aplanochytrium stocchinoi, Strain GSBS06" /LENGTH=156 /DNA_ID=CAMNT_0051952135 /DNA_START=225 /DNA_END=695 /DNA_ORIENTATION=-
MGNECCCASRAPQSDVEERREEAAIEDAFSYYDTNKNNIIEPKELGKVLEKILQREPTKVQINRIFKKVDLNRDEKIDLSEFKAMMKERKDTKNSYMTIFRTYDVNKDGYISKEELFNVLNQVEETSEKEVDDILALADVDKDGRIDFLEFLDFWC